MTLRYTGICIVVDMDGYFENVGCLKPYLGEYSEGSFRWHGIISLIHESCI